MKKDEAFEWFVQGFKETAEGHNFEYPFCDTDDSDFREQIKTRFEKRWKELEEE